MIYIQLTHFMATIIPSDISLFGHTALSNLYMDRYDNSLTWAINANTCKPGSSYFD